MAVHLAYKKAGHRSLQGQLLPLELPALLATNVEPTASFGVVQNFAAPTGGLNEAMVLVVQPDVDVWFSIGKDPKATDQMDCLLAGSRVAFAVYADDKVGLTTTAPTAGVIA